MSELKREELLEKVEELFDYYMEMNLKFLEGDELSKFKQAYEQIKALIQKPGVTEEWIEEKAKAHVCNLLDLQKGRLDMWDNEWVRKTKDFIRALVEEIQSEI